MNNERMAGLRFPPKEEIRYCAGDIKPTRVLGVREQMFGPRKQAAGQLASVSPSRQREPA